MDKLITASLLKAADEMVISEDRRNSLLERIIQQHDRKKESDMDEGD